MISINVAPQAAVPSHPIAISTQLPTGCIWEILKFVHPIDYLQQGIYTGFSDAQSLEIIRDSIAQCFRRILKEQVSLEAARRITEKLTCIDFSSRITVQFLKEDDAHVTIQQTLWAEYLPNVQNAGVIMFPSEREFRLFARVTPLPLPDRRHERMAPGFVYAEITSRPTCSNCAAEEFWSYFSARPNTHPASRYSQVLDRFILYQHTDILIEEIDTPWSSLNKVIQELPALPSAEQTETSTTANTTQAKARVSWCSQIFDIGWSLFKRLSPF